MRLIQHFLFKQQLHERAKTFIKFRVFGAKKLNNPFTSIYEIKTKASSTFYKF